MARYLIVPILIAGLLGCSSGEVKLGVDVAAIKTAAPSVTVTAGDVADATSPLTVSRVRLLVGHAKVGYTGGGQSGGAAADTGPIVVDLTEDEIANGAHREFDLGALPSGTYGGAEIEIQPLEADQDASDAALADFRAASASLLVDGTYDGKSFQFAGHFLAEQGTDGEVTIDASSPAVLTMTVDPSTWFLDAEGAPIDPADEAQHDATAVAICKTLDTQEAPAGAPGAQPAHAGGDPGGRRGGGGAAHCVEQAAN